MTRHCSLEKRQQPVHGPRHAGGGAAGGGSDLPRRVDLSAIRYANCWEDADLLVSRLGDVRGRRVLSICSGGENSLSLLFSDPGQLVVVDKSPAQLFLFELKKTAMSALGRDEFLAFLGYALLVPEWALRWEGHPGNEPKYLRQAVDARAGGDDECKGSSE